MSKILNHVRTRLESLYDPTIPFAEAEGIRDLIQPEHIGAFIIAYDEPRRQQVCKVGHHDKPADDPLQTLNDLIPTVYADLTKQGISIDHFKRLTIDCHVITHAEYLADPIAGFQPDHGIYLQWGQTYKGCYLPSEIKRMKDKGLSPAAILDRLTAWECGLASNLWRTECGLCYRLVCSDIP